MAPSPSSFSRFLTTTATIASWALVGAAAADAVASVAPVAGGSMAPALRGVRDVDDPALPGARDYVLVNWAVVSFPGVGGLFPHRPAGGHAATVGGFRRGDVVVLTDPRGGGAGGGGGGGGWADWWSTARGERLVKRLVGLPSDLVVSTEGRYGGGEGVLTQVPDGYCWVEGDVRTAGARGGGGVSVDSHVFGPVPLALLDGRVEAIVWPPGRAGRVPPPPPAAAGRVVIPGEPAAPTAAGEGEPPPAGA